MSSVNGNNFTSFQFGGLLFLFLSPCWTVVARAGIPVPDLRGKAFSLSPLGMMLTTDFHVWPLLHWSSFSVFLVCSVFFTILLYHRAESFSQCNKGNKGNKSHPYQSGRKKMVSICKWHDCLYRRSTEINSNKNCLEQVGSAKS